MEHLILHLTKLPFFSTLTESDLALIKEPNAAFILCFSSKECISEAIHSASCIGVLLSGTATVHNAQDDPACLRLLQAGNVFGAAALFAPSPQPISTIRAKGDCEVCFLTYDLITNWIARNQAFALSYIRFLSDRILFLNGRITAFTASCATQKLHNYLLEQSKKEFPFTLTVNAVRLASMLNIGRASLYRAFDALEQAGILKKNKKEITVFGL